MQVATALADVVWRRRSSKGDTHSPFKGSRHFAQLWQIIAVIVDDQWMYWTAATFYAGINCHASARCV